MSIFIGTQTKFQHSHRQSELIRDRWPGVARRRQRGAVTHQQTWGSIRRKASTRSVRTVEDGEFDARAYVYSVIHASSPGKYLR